MKRPLIRALVAGIVLVGGSAAVAGPAIAAPSDTASTVRHAAATTKGAQQRVESYWTKSRMESATPVEQRYGIDTAKAPSKQNKGKKVQAEPESPQPELGKVFFTLGGTDYVCSGTATSSGNGDVVTTAGHCVNEGPGDFATNFAFVPAYENGNAPYGTWTAETLYTTTQWGNSGDFDYDAGFAVMAENSSGESLTDVVGSISPGFNLDRGLDYTSYGYPAGPPFDGESLYSCSGTAHDDTFGGSNDQGLSCDMTGGSSGGGWITGGKLNSVNSFKYTTDNSTMYGPYFGDVIESVYNEAAAA